MQGRVAGRDTELLLDSERLLRNILPVSVAEKLKRGERSIAAAHPEVTVLFADVVGFSAMASRISADELVATLYGPYINKFQPELLQAEGGSRTAER